MYQSGISTLEISNTINVCRKTIRSIFKRHGIVVGNSQHKKAYTLRRFMSKVRKRRNGCWEWQGYINPKTGYGRFSLNDICIHAHRASYIFHVGDIADDLVVDHICRNKRCVNPVHLRAVTVRENTMYGNAPSSSNARKTHCIRGHELSGRNLYVLKRGERVCRKCNLMRTRKYQKKNR